MKGEGMSYSESKIRFFYMSKQMVRMAATILYKGLE
jgi:hypothetical protein